MTTYIAFLRGINVGGKNMIKMTLLKQMFETIGLEQVQTYIQSGNVLFKSREEEEWLRNSIENEITKTFGFSISVVLRSLSELELLIENYPFSGEEVREAESVETESQYVSLYTHAPSQSSVEHMKRYINEDEKCSVAGRDAYFLLRNGIRTSKLANHLQKMDVPSTVRNWKTMNTLVELAREMNVSS